MKNLIDLAFTALASFIIGGLVGLPYILFTQGDLFPSLLKSALVGLFIGIVAAISFAILYRNIHKNILLGFFAVFITIGTGTFLGVYILGGYYQDGRPMDPLPIIGLVCLAECAGMIASVVMFRKTNRMNAQLRLVQKQYQQQTEDKTGR